jgi:hypothetical protein
VGQLRPEAQLLGVEPAGLLVLDAAAPGLFVLEGLAALLVGLAEAALVVVLVLLPAAPLVVEATAVGVLGLSLEALDPGPLGGEGVLADLVSKRVAHRRSSSRARRIAEHNNLV